MISIGTGIIFLYSICKTGQNIDKDTVKTGQNINKTIVKTGQLLYCIVGGRGLCLEKIPLQ